MRRVAERERADKNGDGKTDTSDNSDRMQLPPCDPVRNLSKARANRQPGKSYDSQRLPHDEPEQNSPSNPAGQQAAPRSSGKRYSGVGQCEQGQDKKRNPVVQFAGRSEERRVGKECRSRW